jgi:hypothetical protein
MKSRDPLNIEVEFRSRFNKKRYLALQRFLASKAKDLGRDNKDVYFLFYRINSLRW